MVGKFMFVLFVVAIFQFYSSPVSANPAIITGYDPMEVCIENCAQCKKMLGAWFEGQLCAESCIKYRGKVIPDCENYASISPFLNKF